MSRIWGSSASRSLSTGRTADAPECLIISSLPVLPFGQRTVSIERSTMRPSWTGSRSTNPGCCASVIYFMHLDGAQLEVADFLLQCVCVADNGPDEFAGADVFTRSRQRRFRGNAAQAIAVLREVIIR